MAKRRMLKKKINDIIDIASRQGIGRKAQRIRQALHGH